MTKVTLNNIWKSYKSEEFIVKDVNFSAEEGEFLVLVGPSGCGKTTILRMIAGLEDITRGELFFANQKMNDVIARERDVGMVFQNYALYPHLTVFENIAFPLSIRGEKKKSIKSSVEQVADILGLNSYLNHKPKELSGGQRQRVALGRAIIRKPKVFLFDEPLSNLDAKLRVQMRTEVSRLHSQLGTTSIYVTHDQVEAMTMGTKLVVLNDGIIQQIASPSEIYGKPANLFVAGFIGSPQINLFDGRIEQSDGLKFISSTFTIGIEKHSTELDKYIGKKVTLALRPEHIRICENDETADFGVKIENIEHLGYEVLLYFMIDGEIKSSRNKTYSATSSELGSFIIDRNNFLFFNEFGNRID